MLKRRGGFSAYSELRGRSRRTVWASFSEESLIEMPPAGLEAISYTGHGEKSQTEKAKPREGSAMGNVCWYERLPSRLAIVLLRTVM
jgi:hypothetical protein